MKNKKATISLSIIVKNESHVILKMLNSVYTLLDYYVVVDTGSSDGTQDIIKKFFDEKGIPGEIISHKWKNYGDARNVALEAIKGKADFGFWIDADDQLEIDNTIFDVEEFKLNLFKYDGIICDYFNYWNFNHVSFFSTTQPWKWFGALHETLECEKSNVNLGYSDGLRIVQYSTGSSWQNPNKWQDYVDMMEDFMLTTDIDHFLYPRWLYYMGQTYAEVGNLVKALEFYEKRSIIKNGQEDIYISLMKIADLKHRLGYDINDVICSYLKCTKEIPYRVEHLIPVINYYNIIGDYHTAYIYSSYAMRFAGKVPEKSLLVDSSVYIWKIYDLHNISSWWSGRVDEAKETFVKLWVQVERGLVTNKDDVERLTANKYCNIP